MRAKLQEQKRRVKLRLKTGNTSGFRMAEDKVTGARRNGTRAVFGVALAGLLLAGAGQQARAQAVATGSKLGPAAPVSYDNRYEVYGGINFMNFQAGQNLPKRMNLAGGEILGTYWLTHKLGLGADYRIEAGTTPVFANAGITTPSTNFNGTGINNRPLVSLNTFMLGAQYRGPKNQFVAVNYHAYGGVSHGTFNHSFRNILPGADPYAATGLYTNRTKPIFALGGSIDFNRSKNLAVRLSPDLILEHFGTETREFFSISGGVIYRFGKR